MDVLKRVLGQRGERKAESFLKRQGLSCLKRNYTCRMGEIDLIMQQDDALVFVEVRLRSRRGYGDGADSIDAAKRRKLVLAARHYLMKHPQRGEMPCRFDVISLDGDTDSITWIPNAFES